MYYPQLARKIHNDNEELSLGLPTPNLHEPSVKTDWEYTQSIIDDFAPQSAIAPLGKLHAVIDYFYYSAAEPEFVAVFGANGSVLLEANYGVELTFTPVEMHDYSKGEQCDSRK